MVQKLLPQKAQPLSCSHSGRLGNTAGEKVRQKSTQGKPSADRCIPEHFSEVDCRVMGRKSPCCYFALFYLFYFHSGFNDNTTKLSFFRNENTGLVGIEKSNNGQMDAGVSVSPCGLAPWDPGSQPPRTTPAQNSQEPRKFWRAEQKHLRGHRDMSPVFIH